MSATERNLTCACLVTVGLVLGYIENLFPIIPLYGLKIGFSNLPVLYALYAMKHRDAYTIGVIKCVLCGLLFSGILHIAYGICGIVLALLGMQLAQKQGAFSIFGVSVAGSALFQIGQTAVACLVLRSAAPLYYLSFLLLGSVPCGLLSAFLVKILLSRLKEYNKHEQ